MKMYRLDTWLLPPQIVEVKCEKVTDKCVFINGRKRAKVSDGTVFFEDFESAKKESIEHMKHKIESSKTAIKIHEVNIKRYESHIALLEKSKENPNV